ncbi:DUF924 family protein [Phormidium sp. CCY1219]|uniref:DUF924 family protein n=1 Tax=Phormidium sp. CCY1219 TaxID=2886104 RepID=UPI002D1ED4FB|nr:DUF924 family protein [Phormidium sp. CCY1219]MEB3830474.1 DUF924 domain-containing protein [Phormidium sp. CCY1219]
MSRVEKILEFWFGKPEDPEYGKSRKIWFTKDAEFDETVRSHFLADYEMAAQGLLEGWKDAPESCLALILLLDQFPRNLFRATPQAFATDPQALAAAQHAIERGYDKQMLPVKRWFFYLPFEHSENLEHQHQAIALFCQLSDDPESASAIDYAERHRAIIERFGRFPHRNAILRRKSTPEEREFLQQPGSGF